ncbi:MAG: type II 3-dehydroquinate dehydratase [Alphaproteobacteria bacterium]|nr:type II 3-dehydroquinate dehydratase [Alphaproteobacteria bacterium]
MTTEAEILVINGPNLDRLGTRQPEIYGHTTLADIEGICRDEAALHGLTCRMMQSSDEGEIVQAIHRAIDDKIAGIIINAGAYTHTSVAIRDALSMVEAPVIEVHISNIYKREEFRHHSYISGVATGVIAGLGPVSYRLAVTALASHI